MKTFRLLCIIAAIAVILVAASMPYHEKSSWFSQLPKFDLYKHGFVSSAFTGWLRHASPGGLGADRAAAFGHGDLKGPQSLGMWNLLGELTATPPLRRRVARTYGRETLRKVCRGNRFAFLPLLPGLGLLLFVPGM